MFEIGKLTRLDLGYQGENKARVIAIDMKAWLDEFPGAMVGIMIRRPEEDVFYPAALEMEDGIIEFEVTRSDVAIAGEGEAQIILTNKDDVELRSRIVKTKISPSLTGTEVEAPPPQQTWVGEVLQAAQKAEEAVGHMPVIGENGNWYAWDADEDAYEDTGRPSKGERGEKGLKGDTGPEGPQGKTGPQGPQGERGLTGPKGDKGDTGPQGPKGDKGETGATGPKGDKGPAGPQGDKGDTGERGPKGDTGATGPQGEQGPAGKDGTGVTILGSYTSLDALKTAHPTGSPGDAYLIEGYLYVWSASDNEWKNVGKIQGPQGERGPKGDTGDTGPTGPKGDKGDTGATGPAGPAGSDGAPGKDGYTPEKGKDYYTAADKAELVEAVKSQIGEVDGDYAPAIHADQHSWNDTLTWDGDETGHETVVQFNTRPIGGETIRNFVHMSDAVPTLEDLVGKANLSIVYDFVAGAVVYDLAIDESVIQQYSDNAISVANAVYIIGEDNCEAPAWEYGDTAIFPKKGVYLIRDDMPGDDNINGGYASLFAIPGYNFAGSTDPITPERIGAAPSYHASESAEHGVGTDKKYGHLKVADVEEVFIGGEEKLLDIAIELPNDDPMIDLKPYAFGAATGWLVSNFFWECICDTDGMVIALDEIVNNLRLEVIKLRNEVDALKGGS